MVQNYELYNVEAYLVIKYHQDKNSKKYRLYQQNDIMCPVEQEQRERSEKITKRTFILNNIDKSYIIYPNIYRTYTFSRRFYPKRLTLKRKFVSMCVPWELNPQPLALLTQCSTTEPQEHYYMYWLLTQ